MSKKTIALLLKSPMQAWGIDSRFKHRTTFTYPTKSAVVGIICAAMGIDKYAPEANAKLKDLCDCKFYSYQLHPSTEKDLSKRPSDISKATHRPKAPHGLCRACTGRAT